MRCYCISVWQQTAGYAQLTVSAARARGVRRLVALSSMGLGEVEYIPFGFIRVLWAILLRTWLRDGHGDLLAMEKVLLGQKEEEQGLDTLVARAVGLTPEAPVRRCWHLLTAPYKGSEPLNLSVSKPDIALFLFKEAMTPTTHRSAVTLAGPMADQQPTDILK